MRILHIEDNAQDAELVRVLLREEWTECEITVVTSVEELRTRITQGGYDLVLSDYSLGAFTGIDALRVVREIDPALPFIFLSGTIGEDRAIEAVRAGAQDYVIKDRMKRLVTAIHRSIRDSQEQRKRTQAEQQVREQADLLNKASDAIIVTDLADKITFWNKGAERISGWAAAEVIGKRPEEVLGVGYHAKIDEARTALAASGEWRGELQLHDRNGKPLVVEVGMTLVRDDSGKPKARLSIGTDVSAKKALEEQVLRAQRLESIGMLASGIAHDLNNVLSPIFLAAPLLREQLTNPVHIRMVTTLERSAERGAGLVRQILSFAHGAGEAHRVVQLKHILRESCSVMAETFPKNIQLEDHVPGDLLQIVANPTQVHQVVLNLCVNARDAMPSGGRLTVSAENCILDDQAALAIEGARPGTWVVVRVKDTGTGIPRDVVERIWDPFFTTKEAGKGTGLGLSTVRGIVQGHKGFLTLETKEGRGTTFSVYFPAEEEARDAGKSGSVHPFVVHGNGELILIVDDEAQIRDVIATTLSHFGYRVLVARDGTEALALFSKRGPEISAVVTDMSMPNLDGAALVNVLHQLSPALRILVMSGLNSGAKNPQVQKFTGAFMAKPFTAEALLRSLSSLLRAAPPAGQG